MKFRDRLRQVLNPRDKSKNRSIWSVRSGIKRLPAMLSFALLASAIAAPLHTLASTTVEIPNQSDWTGAGPLAGTANVPISPYSITPSTRSITLGANKSFGYSGTRSDYSVAASGRESLLLAALEADSSFTPHRDPADGATGFNMDIARVFDPVTGNVTVNLASFGARLSFPDASANPVFLAGTRCVNILDFRSTDFPLANQKIIDNTLGLATFIRSNSTGVPAPARLGHALTRLTGSANQECRLDFEVTSLSDVEGNQIAVPTGVNRVLRRGDARADGVVDIADALFVAQHLVGLRDACITEINTSCLHSVNTASVKHDGSFDQVTIADARSIAENLVGLKDGFYNSGPPKVDISLMPDRKGVNVGEQFNVEVKVYAGAARRVDAAQVYLDFNPSIVNVVALTRGTALPDQFQSTFDNTLGQIAYAAGKGVGTPNDSVASPFDLVTATFQAVGASGQAGIEIVFAPLTAPRETKTIFGVGPANTGQLFPTNIAVFPGQGSIALLSDSFDRPDSPVIGEGWIEGEQAGATVSIANNKLFYDDTSDVLRRPVVSRSFAPVSTGTLRWDFDFDWAKTAADENYEFWMQLGDGTQMVFPSSSSTQFTGVGVNLRWGNFSNTDQSLVARQDPTKGGPTTLTTISGLTHVSVTADLGSKTYSVTIDGVEVGSGLSFENLSTVSRLDRVRFFTNRLDDQNFSGRTIDNVNISVR